MKLTPEEKQFLIEKIAADETLPDDFREKLFPAPQKEYELRYAGKMAREDVLADHDGTSAVPLQTGRVFYGRRDFATDGWHNLIIFGDNLQFLKTCYADREELIRHRVKSKVKLIYIDPPFGTGYEYEGRKGQRGYTAKRRSADFVEFLRRRLIVARELLADDGVILIRQDYHFGHYIKLALDEIFGKENFRNEITVNRIKKNTVLSQRQKVYPTATDTIYFYAKSDGFYLEDISRKRAARRKAFWRHMDDSAGQGGEKIFFGKTLRPPVGKHFKYSQKNIGRLIQERKLRLVCKVCAHAHYEGSWSVCPKCGGDNVRPEYHVEASDITALGTDWTDIAGYTNTIGYPTENSEALLERIIKGATIEGDLVMDFFGGSGTTAAVAEKLNRRWIVCDIGKLSFYTMQKRLLTIRDSRSLIDTKKKYGALARPFMTVNTGLYDLETLNTLDHESYIEFAMRLFEVERNRAKLSGVQLHGKRKDNCRVMVWEYWKQEGGQVDELFLENLHRLVGKRIGARLYIIAPAHAVRFTSDYQQLGDVRYYFLKIPYQVIRELHRAPLADFRQPQGKSKVNDLEDAIGFHFMRQPEVESRFANGKLRITKFLPNAKYEATDNKHAGNERFANFETLAMLILDENYNGKEFVMTSAHFAAELIRAHAAETKEEGRNHCDEQTQIVVPLGDAHGERIAVVFIDIFGNEFRQEFRVR